MKPIVDASPIDQPLPEKALGGHINSFQYPPPVNIAPLDAEALRRMLCLGEHRPTDDLFTVFLSMPYCRVRCFSCPYYLNRLPTEPDTESKFDAYVDILVDQISRFGHTQRFLQRPCGAVYFGGGTGSLLSPRNVQKLVTALRQAFLIPDQTEITLEGNPHDFTENYLSEIRDSGVNRVSLGLQSFDTETLKYVLNSPHTASESFSAIENAISAGFRTVNVDLLYRLPGQTFENWRQTIKTALSFHPEGITIYSYVVHSSSASDRLLREGKLQPQPDMHTTHRWYKWARSLFLNVGYVEHRKGSFSTVGHCQRYGALTYGEGCELIGIGAGAYGYINNYQWVSPSSPEQYVLSAKSGHFPIVQKMSDQAFGRRFMERAVIFAFLEPQLDREAFRSRFGVDAVDEFGSQFSFLAERGLVSITRDRVALTDLGLAFRGDVQRVFYTTK